MKRIELNIKEFMESKYWYYNINIITLKYGIKIVI